MELKSFVTQALVEIVEAVKDAQEQAAKIDALINPKGSYYPQLSTSQIRFETPDGETHFGQLIEFDISVTASERDETQGGVGIQVASITIGAGISGRTEDQNSVVSRLKFSVPIFLPEDSRIY